MKALMRDRERRRYRHNWERSIAGLLAAARGKDAAAGLLEAGRARYALYRWSANEGDREKALLLANRAARMGSRDARTLATAIRREAGDEAVEIARPARPRAERRPGARAAPPGPPSVEAEDEEPPPDPALTAALADLSAPSVAPAPRPGESEDTEAGTRPAQPQPTRAAEARVTRPDGDGSAGSRPPALAAPPSAEEATTRAVRRIVIDAGHGGHDPGAIGARGLREKDLTLDIALKVAVHLRQAGFDVLLTRSTDRFLQLEERTALANTARADLFVSIHVNAHPRRNRSGIETYFLNVSDDRYAARLAARENGAEPESDPSDGDLRRIRSDLDAVASAGSSRRLAELMQGELCKAVRGRFGEVRDLGVKSALFYVLLGARMPAVLVETGFISNRGEEGRLATAAYREEVARSVTRAVRTFAGADDRVAAVR
jgi:N-acetylmuramoyl-L-alanine amidase